MIGNVAWRAVVATAVLVISTASTAAAASKPAGLSGASGSHPLATSGGAHGQGAAGERARPRADGNGSSPDYLVSHGGFLWFRADAPGVNEALWRSDGSASGTTAVVPDVDPRQLVWAGTRLFFEGYSPTGGDQLFVSDGTMGRTRPVQTGVPPDAFAGDPSNITAFGSRVVFEALNADGEEPWISDGTPAGTYMLRDIVPGSSSSYPFNFARVGPRAVFVAFDPHHGGEVWGTDGSRPGTSLLRDIYPGQDSSFPFHMTRYRQHVLFFADDGAHGAELWTTDGTTAGTHLVKDIAPGTLGSAVFQEDPPLVQYAGRLFFAANDGTHNDELWTTDGTKLGTKLVADIWPGPRSGNPSVLAASAHGLLLAAENAKHGYELWRTNNTAAGTVFVRDIRPGVFSSNPGDFGFKVVSLGREALFEADDGVHGEELWRSNGTGTGTSLLMDINPGATSSSISSFTRVGSRAFFAADDGTHGDELWVSDGTSSGTRLVADLYP